MTLWVTGGSDALIKDAIQQGARVVNEETFGGLGVHSYKIGASPLTSQIDL